MICFEKLLRPGAGLEAVSREAPWSPARPRVAFHQPRPFGQSLEFGETIASRKVLAFLPQLFILS